MMVLCFFYAHSVFPGDPKGLAKRVLEDASLIVPGIGSEKIVLGSSESDVVRMYPRSEYVISRPGSSELFRDVLKIETNIQVVFDKVFHFNEDRFAVFLVRGRVCAITGFSLEKVTARGVALDRGADYFVFSCGNKGMKAVKQGKNVLYLYADAGIAIADDDGDDDIDLYAVFPSGKSSSLK